MGTVLWAQLLRRRAGAYLTLAVLGGALLVGSSVWLEQSIQLKQYTLDVLVALLPFSLGDDFFDAAFVEDRRRSRLAVMAIPCVISYTYQIALAARALGWYANHARYRGWRLRAGALAAFVVPIAIGLAIVFISDYRFYWLIRESYFAYWRDAISSRLERGFGSGLGLIGNFLWGWQHGRLMAVAIAAVAPLQVLGVYRVLSRWKNRDSSTDDRWGSRTLGSLLLLTGTIIASLVLSYPIKTGRLVLFTQVHAQVLALEGGLLVLGLRRSRALLVLFLIAVTVLTVYSLHRYVVFVRSEPPENIYPMLPLIDREAADIIYVHPCSVAQVESLPEQLPVDRIELAGKRQLSARGEKTWILWTNISDDYCHEWMEAARWRAVSCQVVHEGPGRGLALAQY